MCSKLPINFAQFLDLALLEKKLLVYSLSVFCNGHDKNFVIEKVYSDWFSYNLVEFCQIYIHG